MEFAAKQFEWFKRSFSGLTRSGWIAIGLCFALIILSLAWLSNWAGQADRVALFEQPLTTDEQNDIVDELRATGADYVIEDGKILVKAEERRLLIARLGQARALPANTSISFSSVMEGASPFTSREDSRWNKERALESELSAIIGEFEQVASARVLIQTPERRRIGGPSNRSTASVQVQLRSGRDMNAHLVESIARLVAGAVEGLEPHDVQIADALTGRNHRIPDPNDPLAIDVLAERQKRESHYMRKIQDHLSYIPGVLVGVYAEIDMNRKVINDVEYGKVQVSDEETRSSRSTQSSPNAAPGARPNVGAAITGGGRDQSTETEETRTGFSGARDETRTHTTVAPGEVRRLTASINVPRAYFAAIFRQLKPDATDPTDDDLKPVIEQEQQKIRTQVKPLIAAVDDAQVEVDWYYDQAMMVMASSGGGFGGAGMLGGAGGADEGMVGQLMKRWPQIGAIGLALIAVMWAVRRMRTAEVAIREVGRAVDRAQGLEESGKPALDRLGADVALAGEAFGGETVLEGQELGEADMQLRHIVEQLGQLIDEDTSTAVTLLEQWINSGKS
jgi:flagellar M-ring protein FliF